MHLGKHFGQVIENNSFSFPFGAPYFGFMWLFSRRWLFNKCHFISFIRIILIDRAYYLKENLIGIFPVGVVFLFISFVKYI